VTGHPWALAALGTARTYRAAGAAVPVQVLLRRGVAYEVRVDVGVLVAPGGAPGQLVPVQPQSPLLFVADVDSLDILGPAGALVAVRAALTPSEAASLRPPAVSLVGLCQ